MKRSFAFHLLLFFASSPDDVEPPPGTYKLWTGPPIPTNVEKIPFVEGVEHRTIHRASEDGYKFLHGAAIVQHKGVLFSNWANSPVNENGPHETLQGRRSSDGGVNWSELEVIGPGFEGPERHSHGVLFVHKGELWTICSRFGVGQSGRRFPGLQAEAFVLDEQTDRWKSRGIVTKNCWSLRRARSHGQRQLHHRRAGQRRSAGCRHQSR